MGRLMGVQVVGIGSSIPNNSVKNEDLASLGYDADWIFQRTGILERQHAPEGIATSDLSIEAGQRCIEAAGVNPQDVDLLLLGTLTPDMKFPATASFVQDKLGLCAPAMDLNAACASFVFAMITGAQFIATGCSQLALIIGADCMSRVVNPVDKKTYPLFGDAAGAVLLAAGGQEQGIESYAVGTEGSGAGLLNCPMGGSRMPYSAKGAERGLQFMHMDGRPVFKWAVRVLTETITDVLTDADTTLDDVDLVIFHQANMRIIDAASKELGIDPKKLFCNVQRYGNTSAASIPLALDEAHREGRVRRGDRILLSGFGAGLAWGTMLLEW